MIDATSVGNIVAALLTLFIMSFALVRPNKLSEFATATFIATAFSVLAAQAFSSIVNTAIIPLSQGKIIMIIPLALGLMVFTPYTRYKQLSSWPTALLIGVGTGLTIRGMIEANVVKQIIASALPIFNVPLVDAINNIIIIVSLLSVMTFFIFTGKLGKTKTIEPVRKIGRYMIMAFLGASFASYFMLRVNLIIDRLSFLLSVIGIS